MTDRNARKVLVAVACGVLLLGAAAFTVMTDADAQSSAAPGPKPSTGKLEYPNDDPNATAATRAAKPEPAEKPSTAEAPAGGEASKDGSDVAGPARRPVRVIDTSRDSAVTSSASKPPTVVPVDNDAEAAQTAREIRERKATEIEAPTAPSPVPAQQPASPPATAAKPKPEIDVSALPIPQAKPEKPVVRREAHTPRRNTARRSEQRPQPHRQRRAHAPPGPGVEYEVEIWEEEPVYGAYPRGGYLRPHERPRRRVLRPYPRGYGAPLVLREHEVRRAARRRNCHVHRNRSRHVRDGRAHRVVRCHWHENADHPSILYID